MIPASVLKRLLTLSGFVLAESLLDLVDRQPGFRTLDPHADLRQQELLKAVQSSRCGEKGGGGSRGALAGRGG